jgi:hypothetical protein
MTSKIKVDNINKVSDDSNIIKKCGTTTTIGSGASNPIVVDGSAVTLGRCGGTVALASGATQTGFGRTGTVDWQTSIKTGNFTAVSGEGYFVNTTSGGITMTLPASPSAGAIVSVKDYANTFDTNNLTVNRNSSPIGGGSDFNPTFSAEGVFLTFIYADATKGWLITDNSTNTTTATEGLITATGGSIATCGNFKIHTFTGPGTFEVTNGGGPIGLIDYRVIAGGGAGGVANGGGGGGGAGGHRTSFPSPSCNAGTMQLSPGSYPVTVGAGGAGATSPTSPGGGTAFTGSNSVFAGSSTITSAGGGGGGTGNTSPNTGDSGGSGGGGGKTDQSSPGAGAAGNTPPVSPPQGNPGGTGGHNSGGGGGGAGGTGGNSPSQNPPSPGGAGGNGTANSITGAAVTLAGGGGGNSENGSGGGAGPGGAGAGGGPAGSPAAGSATANTGSGGGGADTPGGTSGSGGSGIVIIRYKFQ